MWPNVVVISPPFFGESTCNEDVGELVSVHKLVSDAAVERLDVSVPRLLGIHG